MAGFLPDVPGVRIPYHIDGSLMLIATAPASSTTPNGAWSQIVSNVNSNDGTIATNAGSWSADNRGYVISTVFPQPINLVGYNYEVGTDQTTGAAAYSLDTTDGIDGTWTAMTAPSFSPKTDITLRQTIVSVNIANVTGVRLAAHRAAGSGSFVLRELAIYGEWSTVGVRAWHPTLDERLSGAGLDFGDVILGNIYTKQFRVKNLAAQTANDVVISSASGSPIMLSGMSYSLDGTNFTSSVQISSIAPGAISGIVYVRRTVGSSETTNVASGTAINLNVTSWS